MFSLLVLLAKVRLLTCKVVKGSVLWPGGTVCCFPGPFCVVSLVNRIGFISFPGHFGDCRVHLFQIFKRFCLKIDIMGFESFVPCTGQTAGPPFMSGLAGQPSNWVVRVHSCLSFGKWGFSFVIVMVLLKKGL